MPRLLFALVSIAALPALAAGQSPREVAQQGWAAHSAGEFRRARTLFARSCEANDPIGCAGMFQMNANGDGGPQNRERARSFGQRACDLGHPDVCVELGRWALAGADADPPRAATLFARACELRNSEGCGQLGVMRMNGDGGPADPAGAKRLLTTACDARNQLACTNLGILLANGPEGVRDAAAARRRLSWSCEAGHARGCSVLGMLTRDGVGGPSDPAAAIPLFRRACDGNDRDACLNLGSAYFEGRGVARDVAQARVFYDKACDAGQPIACANLRQIDRPRNTSPQTGMAPRPTAGAEAAAPDRPDAPRWSVRMGSVDIDGMHFRDVRSTCPMLMTTGVLQAVGNATRSCDLGRATPRVAFELRGGRASEVSATPAGAPARCIARRTRRVRVGSLSCQFEVTLAPGS